VTKKKLKRQILGLAQLLEGVCGATLQTQQEIVQLTDRVVGLENDLKGTRLALAEFIAGPGGGWRPSPWLIKDSSQDPYRHLRQITGDASG
jgi:hypothetical protein